eukprot:1459227-Pleurochrysis_carterae.AAC.2
MTKGAFEQTRVACGNKMEQGGSLRRQRGEGPLLHGCRHPEICGQIEQARKGTGKQCAKYATQWRQHESRQMSALISQVIDARMRRHGSPSRWACLHATSSKKLQIGPRRF